MKNTTFMETMVGFFVAIGIIAFLMLSLKVSNLGSFFQGEQYTVSAWFSNIGGLKIKSPVKISGVKVGTVSHIEFDEKRAEATVSIEIGQQYRKIPNDSIASIYTAGLLGEQYIGLEIGGDDTFLSDGDELDMTQSAVILEQLIGQFLYQSAQK